MRPYILIILIGLLLGDGPVAAIAAVKLLRDWRTDRLFIVFGLLMLSCAALVGYAAVWFFQLPRDVRVEIWRPVIISLIILAIGLWPANYVILMPRRRKGRR